jgi:hypothetical protein
MSINYKTFGQGNFQQTGPRSGKFTGPKHANGGIKTAGPDGNMIEVEGGESVGEVNTNAGKQPYIYSQYVKRYGGVSYADEFDKLINRGASQQELDMLASEQDSKAQRTDGSIQVTPMQRGGFTNNINNNNMANRLSRRVMQYDSRYRNGGVPQYQGGGINDYSDTYGGGQTYSGVGGDVGPAVQEQIDEYNASPKIHRVATGLLGQHYKDKTRSADDQHWWGKGPWYTNLLNPVSWLGNSILSGPKANVETSYQVYDKLTGGDSEITPGSNFSGAWDDYKHQYGGVPNQQIQPGAYGVHQGDIGQRQTGLQYQGGGFPWKRLFGLSSLLLPNNNQPVANSSEEENFRANRPVLQNQTDNPLNTPLSTPGPAEPMPTNPQMRNPYGYANTAMAPGLGNRVMQYQGNIGTGIAHSLGAQGSAIAQG